MAAGWEKPINRTAELQPLVLSVETGWQMTPLRLEGGGGVGGRRRERSEKRIPPVTQCQNVRPQCQALALTHWGREAARHSSKRPQKRCCCWLALTAPAARLLSCQSLDKIIFGFTVHSSHLLELLVYSLLARCRLLTWKCFSLGKGSQWAGKQWRTQSVFVQHSRCRFLSSCWAKYNKHNVRQ